MFGFFYQKYKISFVLQMHTDTVYDLKFDEFQIVSCSKDGTILIWDFLNYNDTNIMEASSSNNIGIHNG